MASPRPPNPLVELTLARVREFLREPEAVFWVFAFPVLMALALGIAFRQERPQEVVVGVAAPGGGPVARAASSAPGACASVALEAAEADAALAQRRRCRSS